MQQLLKSKKELFIDTGALKELKLLPEKIQARFKKLFEILEYEGFLREPFAKKIGSELFEVRVSLGGQWRALYSYGRKNEVVVLTAFLKKTQKTPKQEIHIAQKRMKKYL
jgi:phage-related protein